MTTYSRWSTLAVVAASAFLGCTDPTSAPAPATRALRALTARPTAGVYVQTNSSSANEVIVYGYDRDGSLVSADSRVLYVLTPGAGTIQSFGIEPDGRLTLLGAASGIPKSAIGLVVR